MSESSNEQSDGPDDQQDDEGVGISDEQLPDELLPSEDNPLAEPLSDEEAPDDMDELDMMGSGSSDSDDSDDSNDSDDSEGSADGDRGADGKSTDGEPSSSDDED